MPSPWRLTRGSEQNLSPSYVNAPVNRMASGWDAVAEALSDLPLALEQAAAYINAKAMASSAAWAAASASSSALQLIPAVPANVRPRLPAPSDRVGSLPSPVPPPPLQRRGASQPLQLRECGDEHRLFRGRALHRGPQHPPPTAAAHQGLPAPARGELRTPPPQRSATERFVERHGRRHRAAPADEATVVELPVDLRARRDAPAHFPRPRAAGDATTSPAASNSTVTASRWPPARADDLD
jgi:hypothetical protein